MGVESMGDAYVLWSMGHCIGLGCVLHLMGSRGNAPIYVYIYIYIYIYIQICIYTYHQKKENKYMDPSIFEE